MRAKPKPRTCIIVEWDGDYWFWRAISPRGEVEAFGGTDRDPDPSARPDEDRLRREAGEMGADVEWDTVVEWLEPTS